MGTSFNSPERPTSHFFKDKRPNETPVFRSIYYPLDSPLPDKFHGNIATLLQAFEYLNMKVLEM